MESRKSGARSQNGGGIRAEEPADFFQRCVELSGVSVSKVLGEDQKVAAFLDGPFGHIHEPSFVSFATATESLGDIGGNGYRRAAHLQRQPVSLLLGKSCGEGVDSQHKLVRLLPYQQILEGPGGLGNG